MIASPPLSGVIGRIARLPDTKFEDIKALWKQLFDVPMPTHNREYLEKRIARNVSMTSCHSLSAQSQRLLASGEQKPTRTGHVGSIAKSARTRVNPNEYAGTGKKNPTG